MDIFINLLVITSLALLPSGNGNEDDASKLAKLADDFWQWRAKNSPVYLTGIGDNRYNDRLEDMRWEMFDERKNAAQEFFNRMDNVDRNKLDSTDKVNYDILKDNLKTYLDGYQWRFFGALNPFNFMEGIHRQPSSFVDRTPFKTWGDFVNYLSRLDKLPTQLNQLKDRHRKAIQVDHTSHVAAVQAVLDEIDALTVENPMHSVFYKPFNDTLENLESIPQSEKNDLRTWAQRSVRTLISAYSGVKTFITNDFMPHTRTSYGVQNWELNGKKYYPECLKWHISLDLTPEEVHQKGLDEVDRISKEMKKIMDKLGKQGTIKEFFDDLKNDPNFHRGTSEELLDMYQELVDNAVTKIPQMFNDYPNLPVRVRPLANDGPARYSTGSDDGSRPGTFWANVLRPEEMLTFTMTALTLHETVPGHHLERSYLKKVKLPAFRKYGHAGSYYSVPFSFPSYTAYGEGWALYAESLGEDLGLYRDDYDMMGRYSSEMFRACRLVVDTGIHHYGWSKDKSVEYMLNYTARSRNGIEVEVERYIAWPGQACSYKIGELKIKELREMAKKELGSYFDIKDFHGVIIGNGRVPLRILEDLVNTWIDTTKANANAKQKDNTGSAPSLSILLTEILTCVTIGKFISVSLFK